MPIFFFDFHVFELGKDGIKIQMRSLFLSKIHPLTYQVTPNSEKI